MLNGATFLPPVEILTLLPMVIAETLASLLSKYPRSSHRHGFTCTVLSLGKWEERRIGAEVNYLIQDVLCHAPFQMQEMVEPEGEA